MKKLIAMLLALTMVFSFATVAFALESESYTSDVKLNKIYTVTGEKDVEGATITDAEAPDLFPHEVLTFTSTASSSNPDSGKANLEIANLTVNGNSQQTMQITLPEYTQVGKYTYTIKENAPTPNTQGVGYSNAQITVTVLVEYAYGNDDAVSTDDKLVATLYLTQTTAENGTQTSQIPVDEDTAVAKVDTFVNTYDLGHMTLSKAVTGNLASQDAYFEFTVEFESDKPVLSDITIAGTTSWSKTTGEGEEAETTYNPTVIKYDSWTNNGTEEAAANKWSKSVTIWLKHGESVQFLNIPAGVKYTVTESSNHLDSDGTVDPNSDADKEYSASYVLNTDTSAKGNVVAAQTVVKDETDSIAYTNDKGTEVSTGITLDSVPYIVMLAVAACGMVVFMTKKRHED